LRGVLVLNDERDAVGVYGLARQFLEWTAHGCYVSRNLKNFANRGEWQRAWNWLTKSIIGNLYMRQNAEHIEREFGMPIPKMPEPLALPALIKAYDTYQLQTYGEGMRSRITNSSANLRTRMAPRSIPTISGKTTAAYSASSHHRNLPREFINRCLVDMLQFIHDVLALSKEETVRPAIIGALKAMIAASERAGIVRKDIKSTSKTR